MPEFTAAMEARVRQAAASIIILAEAKYGVKLGRVEQKFNITSARVLGFASCRRGQLTLRWSPLCIAADADRYIRETVPHEVAHLVCYANPKLGSKHNDGWKRVCVGLGGSGLTKTLRADTTGVTAAAMREALAKKRAVRAVRRSGPGSIVGYLYRTASGEEIRVTSIRHKKMQVRNVTYRSRKDGSVVGKEHFVGILRQ